MLGFATTCGSLVRRRALVRASPLARCLSSAEGGADVAKVTPGGFGTTYARPSTAAESKQKKWTNTVTPWHARPHLVPAERAAVTAADTVNVVGQLAGIPPAMLKRMTKKWLNLLEECGWLVPLGGRGHLVCTVDLVQQRQAADSLDESDLTTHRGPATPCRRLSV